ncbi:MAG: hypothetical protein EB015_21380, partial [Methylocystaceae bacterium]|nr:hypothetical protein [Methylocystaceae bacterium]
MLKRYIAISALIGSISVSAEDTVGLPQLHAQALRDDPTFGAALAQYAADIELFPMAISGLLPTISGGINYSRLVSETPGLSGYSTGSHQLILKQPIFHHDDWIALTEANIQVKLAAATLAAASQDLIYRIAKAYFGVLTADNQVKFTQKQEKTFKTLKKQAEERLKSGVIGVTDLSDVQAQLDTAIAQRIGAENDYKTSLALLQELVPDAIGPFKSLRSTIHLVRPQPEDEAAWATDALKHNWSVRTADYAVQIQQREIWRTQSGHAPVFDAQVTYTKSHAPATASIAASTSVGIGMSLPIFQGGAVLSETRKAKALYEVAKNKLMIAQRKT